MFDKTIFLNNEAIKKLDLRVNLVQREMRLVERILIKQNHPLYDECLLLCHQSKNLYNKALYEVKQQYQQNKTTLSYERLNRLLKNSDEYKSLPAKTSQQTLKLLVQNIKSYFGLKKSKKVSDLGIKPSFPNYYPSNKNREGNQRDDGLCVVTYTNQAIYKTTLKKEGLIHLSQSKIKFKSNKINHISEFNKLAQVRIVPSSQFFHKNHSFMIEVVYTFINNNVPKNQHCYKVWYEEREINNSKTTTLTDKKNIKKEKMQEINLDWESLQHFAAMDLNLNQLALTNYQSQHYLYNLKYLKSINWFYNKQKAKLQSRLDTLKNRIEKVQAILSKETFKQLDMEEINLQFKKIKNRLKKLTTKRNGVINHFSHKLSKIIVENLTYFKVKNLIIGKNLNFKRTINLGKRNNQNFTSIPFDKIFEKLQYKAHLNGINVFYVEESYTSKTSFIEKEELRSYKDKAKKHDYNYIGKRVERGLFLSNSIKQKESDVNKKDVFINADINGALNIARKVMGQYIYEIVDVDSVWRCSPRKIMM